MPPAFAGAPGAWPSNGSTRPKRCRTSSRRSNPAIGKRLYDSSLHQQCLQLGHKLTAAGRDARSFNILYVSSGYDLGRIAEPSSLIEAALRAGAVINTIDPRGFDDIAVPQGVSEAEWAAYLMATRDSLNAIATQTKGMAVFTPSDLVTLQANLANTAR